MKRATGEKIAEPLQVLIESWQVNQRMNRMVLEHLDAAAWRALAPGNKTRTIAAIVVHMHNMRRKWVRLSAPQLKPPAPLDRTRCTVEQAQAAMQASGERCAEMLTDAFSSGEAREHSFLRDGWAKPWAAGAAMAAYMLTHEAHHRGQICMLAHQLGFPLPANAGSQIWNWEKLWKDCRFTRPR
jgi:uncharacterized damage-inducible protein DinB